MSPVELRRHLDEATYAAVAALASRAERDGHPALGEARVLELDRERREPGSVPGFAALVAPEAPGSARLAAYGQLQGGPLGWDLEIAAAPGPEHAERRAAVLRRAVEVVGSAGGGPLQWFVPVAGPCDDALAASVGLAPTRDLLQLRRPLPLEATLAAAAGRVRTRPFRPGADERAVLEVNNAAFATHPDQGGWDEATLADHEGLDWFDPEGLLLAEGVNGRLVGFCWTKREPQTPAIGEIYVLGVAPGHQGEGLGTALLAAGCEHLVALGATTVTLYVDADNHPAVHLYRKAGFVDDHVDRVYGARISPAPASAAGCGGGAP